MGIIKTNWHAKPLSSEEEVEPAQGVFHITCSPNIKGDNNSSCVAAAATHRIIWRSHPPPAAATPHPQNTNTTTTIPLTPDQTLSTDNVHRNEKKHLSFLLVSSLQQEGGRAQMENEGGTQWQRAVHGAISLFLINAVAPFRSVIKG